MLSRSFVFAGILALLLNIKAFKPQIEAAASDALGMDLQIKGGIGFALSPGFGVSLKDVKVRNQGLDVITIEKIRIGLKIIQVGLVKPVFSIVRSKNGMFNLEKPAPGLWENLVDVRAFLLAGPFGPVLTKSFNFISLYEESQGGKGIIRKLVSLWEVKNGVAEARDVALASKNHAWKFIQGEECAVFYSGSEEQPEG